jgi:predicted CoA-binding protein
MTDFDKIKGILTSNKIIAVIGFSDKRERPSNRIARYLHGNGYKVFGVNPRFNNIEIDEIQSYQSLGDIPQNADIINIFRRSEFVSDLMNEILELEHKPKVVWTQIGVISSEAKELAVKNNIIFIENKCIMVEHNKI